MNLTPIAFDENQNNNRPLSPFFEYASLEACKLHDIILNKGLAVTSIKEMFCSIKAVIYLAIAEHGIEGRNPFCSTYMPDEVQEERQPIPLDVIRRIQRDCMAIDDEIGFVLLNVQQISLTR